MPKSTEWVRILAQCMLDEELVLILNRLGGARQLTILQTAVCDEVERRKLSK